MSIRQRIYRVAERWFTRLQEMSGTRGIVAARARYSDVSTRAWQGAIREERIRALHAASAQGVRVDVWTGDVEALSAQRSRAVAEWRDSQRIRRRRGAERLARLALGSSWDEHGPTSTRGDHTCIRGIDFVEPVPARSAPYCDMGGQGIALVAVDRTRVYARSSKWRPSTVSQHYVVGRNEAGTYYAHAVPPASSVREALSWVWSGRHMEIVQRQGDIALIAGPGPKIPALPAGHVIGATHVQHATHPPLPLPRPGQRIIVGRRAQVRAGGVPGSTRD